MKHSALARLIAGNNRSVNAKQPKRQKPDTACDVDHGTEAASTDVVERTTTANGDGLHVVSDDALRRAERLGSSRPTLG